MTESKVLWVVKLETGFLFGPFEDAGLAAQFVIEVSPTVGGVNTIEMLKNPSVLQGNKK